LDVYVLNKSNNKFTKVDLNTYNTNKSYSVHNDGNVDSHVISDSVEIPDAVKDLIAKKERLYVNFKWNDKPETFHGIYDFQNTTWNWVPVTDNAGNEDFDSSSYAFDTAVAPTTNDAEICQEMADFLIYINGSIQPSALKKSIAPNTVISVPNPVPNPVPTSVPNPVPTSVPNPVPTSVPNPVPTSVPNPVPNPNPVPMPQFGNTNAIYIKVIFDGIVPKTVDVVQDSIISSLTDIETYINGISSGKIQSDGTPVYFKLEKTYAENIVKLIS
jgi:hypothetical protein